MRRMFLFSFVVSVLATACGWPPYDIDASSALWSAREMELVAEFAVPRGTGIVEPWGDPEVSFFPSIRFEPEGTSEQLGLFLFDSDRDFSTGQFFDAVRNEAGIVSSGRPSTLIAPDSNDNFFTLPSVALLRTSAIEHVYFDGPDSEIGDVYTFLQRDSDDYSIVTLYADPLPDPSATQSRLVVFNQLLGCQRTIVADLGPPFEWNSASISDVVPVAVGTHFETTLNRSRVVSLFEDAGAWRIVTTRIEDDGPAGDCGDIALLTEMEDLDAPAPPATQGHRIGHLLARDLTTPNARIVVSLPRPDGTYAVFVGTPDGTGLAYRELPDVTDRAIAILSNDLIMLQTDRGYDIVNVAGEIRWSTRSPSLLFTGEREQEGNMYLYFTSGYWARDGGTTTRYTRIYRIRTPQP